MEINSPTETRTIDYYDFTFDNGLGMPVTLDFKAGDTIELGDQKSIVKISDKPSLTNPKEILPGKDVIILMAHVMAVEHYTREIPQLTPEQQAQMDLTIQEMTSDKVH